MANQHWYIERQQKLPPTELQEIQDRVRWANNVQAQPDPSQEPTQPPPILEIIPEDQKRAGKWGTPTDPKGRENCRSGKPH